MSQNTRGLGANRAASIIASVASTAWLSRSYSASSRTKANTNPASPGRTGRIATAMGLSRAAGSHRDLRLDVRMGIVAFQHEILVAEREQVLGGGRKPHGRQSPRRAAQLQPRLLERSEERRVGEECR